MLDFVRNAFRKGLKIILWLILIASAIGGAISFGSAGGNGGYAILGLIVGAVTGAVIGIVIDIIWGGFIATILNMDKNLEILAGKDSSIAIMKAIAPVEMGSFTDSRDNKTYKTIKIGSQTWMAENLNYEAEGSKCYNNDPANGQKYGRLYNWETSKKACPDGWHLPSDAEWDALIAAVGGKKTAGKYLKDASGWNKDGNGVDAIGFAALPGGYGYSDGSFGNVGGIGYWWCATESNANYAYDRLMYYDGESVYRGYNIKSYGLYSVRCVKD